MIGSDPQMDATRPRLINIWLDIDEAFSRGIATPSYFLEIGKKENAIAERWLSWILSSSCEHFLDNSFLIVIFGLGARSAKELTGSEAHNKVATSACAKPGEGSLCACSSVPGQLEVASYARP